MSQTVDVGIYENQQQILETLRNIYDSIVPKPSYRPKVYTVKINKNNASPTERIEYMDDAVGMEPAHMNFDTGKFDYGDWGNVWFIKGNYPVMLKNNGTVGYKLNPNDYSKKEDGSTSDIDNIYYDGNAMARFPKVYLSFTEDSNYEYISVCESKYDETYEPIGFINDNGNEVDEIFLAIYEGTNVLIGTNMASAATLKSISGQTPMGSKTHNYEVSFATNNGTGWYIGTWAQRQMVNALLTIISKSDNSQAVFGYGNYYNNYGEIDTGTLNTAGQFFGYNSSNNAVKVFHIENWWGNIAKRIGGLVAYQGKVYAKMSGPYNTPGSVSTSGYTEVFTYSSEIGSNTSYAVNCKCNNTCGRLPISVGGSSSTYLCDKLFIKYNSNSGADYYYYAQVGGYNYDRLKDGASCLELSATAPGTSALIGATLSYMSQS